MRVPTAVWMGWRATRAGIWRAAALGVALGVGLGGTTGCKSKTPQMAAAEDSGADPADANMAPVEASDGEAAARGVGFSGAPAYGAPAGDAGQVAGAARASSAAAMTRPAVYQAQATPSSSQAIPSSARGAPGYAAAPQRAVNESVRAAQSYPAGQQAPAPVERQGPEGNQQGAGYPGGEPGAEGQQQPGDTDDAQALSDQIYADVDPNETAEAPPPPLPVYDQPPAPVEDDLWTPGYWNYATAGYFWVPGAWVAAPYVGALWTPGWWGPWHGHYGFHRGYWGRHVGFYGGIPYGFGYYGTGYHGGYWNGNHFAYNRAVTNVNVASVRNVYNRTVIVNNVRINNAATNRYVNTAVVGSRASYNGGRGGIQARPIPAEMAAFRGRRTPAMSAQVQNQRAAAANRGQFFQQNGGRPVQTVAARAYAADRVTAPPAVTQPVRIGGSREAQTGVRPGMQTAARPGVQTAVRPGIQTGLANGSNGRPAAPASVPIQQQGVAGVGVARQGQGVGQPGVVTGRNGSTRRFGRGGEGLSGPFGHGVIANQMQQPRVAGPAGDPYGRPAATNQDATRQQQGVRAARDPYGRPAATNQDAMRQQQGVGAVRDPYGRPAATNQDATRQQQGVGAARDPYGRPAATNQDATRQQQGIGAVRDPYGRPAATNQDATRQQQGIGAVRDPYGRPAATNQDATRQQQGYGAVQNPYGRPAATNQDATREAQSQSQRNAQADRGGFGQFGRQHREDGRGQRVPLQQQPVQPQGPRMAPSQPVQPQRALPPSQPVQQQRALPPSQPVQRGGMQAQPQRSAPVGSSQGGGARGGGGGEGGHR